MRRRTEKQDRWRSHRSGYVAETAVVGHNGSRRRHYACSFTQGKPPDKRPYATWKTHTGSIKASQVIVCANYDHVLKHLSQLRKIRPPFGGHLARLASRCDYKRMRVNLPRLVRWYGKKLSGWRFDVTAYVAGEF